MSEPVNRAVQVLDEHDEQPNGEPAVYTYGLDRLYPADMSRVGDWGRHAALGPRRQSGRLLARRRAAASEG